MQNMTTRLLFIFLVFLMSCKKEAIPTCGQLLVDGNEFFVGNGEMTLQEEILPLKSFFIKQDSSQMFISFQNYPKDTCGISQVVHLERIPVKPNDTIFFNELDFFYNNYAMLDVDVAFDVHKMDLEKENWLYISEMNLDTTILEGHFGFTFIKRDEETIDTLHIQDGIFQSFHVER